MLLLCSNTVGRLTPLVVGRLTAGGVRGVPPNEPRQGAVLVHRRLWNQHRFLHPHNWCHAASTFTWLSQVHGHDLDRRGELPSSNLRLVSAQFAHATTKSPTSLILPIGVNMWSPTDALDPPIVQSQQTKCFAALIVQCSLSLWAKFPVECSKVLRWCILKSCMCYLPKVYPSVTFSNIPMSNA